jgi:predicted acylesterase/phospholipase RssA
MVLRLLAGLSCASAILSGCALVEPDRIHFRWTEDAAAPCETCAPAPSSEFVGVAFSGGGSRAAVFAAAGIEALAEDGILRRVTHISSVSGGGFAAAYYAVHRPQSSEAFDEFQRVMRKNFLVDMEIRQFLKPNRLTSSTRRLSSIRDSLDDSFLNERVFADLAPSPVLLLNAARYDDARRFVFSNLSVPDESPGFEPYTEERLRAASFSMPGCERATPREFSLALSVAISAAFPLVLGPAAFEMPATCAGGGPNYWHLGDGGVIDNMGVETLEEVALRALRQGAPYKRIVIFSFDAGKRTPTEAMMAERNLRMWSRDPGRIVDVAAMRAEAYRHLVWSHLTPVVSVPFEIVTLRYTDAQLTEWPPSCRGKERGAEAIRDHIALIPTSLNISDCDADLMEAAARDLVRRAMSERPAAMLTN